MAASGISSWLITNMKQRNIVWVGLNLFSKLLVTILAGDLLYLYYVGGHWYDPNRLIEVTEIVLLWSLAPGGVAMFILELKESR